MSTLPPGASTQVFHLRQKPQPNYEMEESMSKKFLFGLIFMVIASLLITACGGGAPATLAATQPPLRPPNRRPQPRR